MIFCPKGRGLALSLFPGVGEFSLSKNSLGVARGDGQAWNSLIHNPLNL